MNLIINVNTELHSIKASTMGEAKTQSAIKEALEEIFEQSKVNQQRKIKGLKPLPYNATVKDEYGKDLVVIKEARSLEEIRKEMCDCAEFVKRSLLLQPSLILKRKSMKTSQLNMKKKTLKRLIRRKKQRR